MPSARRCRSSCPHVVSISATDMRTALLFLPKFRKAALTRRCPKLARTAGENRSEECSRHAALSPRLPTGNERHCGPHSEHSSTADNHPGNPTNEAVCSSKMSADKIGQSQDCDKEGQFKNVHVLCEAPFTFKRISPTSRPRLISVRNVGAERLSHDTDGVRSWKHA